MPVLKCSDVTGLDCEFEAHESELDTVEEDLKAHIESAHPGWYGERTEEEKESLTHKMEPEIENPNAII